MKNFERPSKGFEELFKSTLQESLAARKEKNEE